MRGLRNVELTPEARIARAKRVLADAVADMVEALVAKGVVASEWIDQDSSPLGHRRHLELVRQKVLKGVREGKKVLVRRSDVEAYLAKRGAAAPVDDDDDIDGMMNVIKAGGRRG